MERGPRVVRMMSATACGWEGGVVTRAHGLGAAAQARQQSRGLNAPFLCCAGHPRPPQPHLAGRHVLQLHLAPSFALHVLVENHHGDAAARLHSGKPWVGRVGAVEGRGREFPDCVGRPSCARFVPGCRNHRGVGAEGARGRGEARSWETTRESQQTVPQLGPPWGPGSAAHGEARRFPLPTLLQLWGGDRPAEPSCRSRCFPPAHLHGNGMGKMTEAPVAKRPASEAADMFAPLLAQIPGMDQKTYLVSASCCCCSRDALAIA